LVLYRHRLAGGVDDDPDDCPVAQHGAHGGICDRAAVDECDADGTGLLGRSYPRTLLRSRT